MSRALDVVNSFYDITEKTRGEGLDTILTEGMVFEGPLMKTSGAEEYISTTKPFLQMHRGTRMQTQFENGDEVCSIYQMDIATPAGGMLTLELSDWIRVKDGKIAEQKIYYDPRELAAAFGM